MNIIRNKHGTLIVTMKGKFLKKINRSRKNVNNHVRVFFFHVHIILLFRSFCSGSRTMFGLTGHRVRKDVDQEQCRSHQKRSGAAKSVAGSFRGTARQQRARIRRVQLEPMQSIVLCVSFSHFPIWDYN